jgi:ribosomal protein S18 acetylase RimI-like enzyme
MGADLVTAPVRVERAAPGSPAPEGFERLGVRVSGRTDLDPSEGTTRWVAYRAGDPIARLTTQVARGLVGAPGRTGLVGHYDAVEADAGAGLLRAAREELAEAGVARVLGPMNGSTWRRYRLALPPEAGDPVFDPPVFLGEPRNPTDYPAHFEAAGFTAVARYESRIETALRVDAPALAADDARLAPAGIRLRALDAARFDAEIRALYDLSVEAFANNLYYTPIAFEEFRALYEAVRPILDASLVLLAEDASGRLVGYLFGYPDSLSDRGAGPTRAVAKTVAVSPAARRAGVGAALLDTLSVAAVRRGIESMIHALMYVENPSMRMSTRHASQIFRRYALYAWSP